MRILGGEGEEMKELDLGLGQAKLQTVDLQKELLVLRLSLGKLRATAQRAFAPVTVPFVESLQKAVSWATRLVKEIGIVLSALTGLRHGQDGYTKSVTKTVKALRRELADFDQLNRLGTPKGGTVTAEIYVPAESFQVPAHLQKIIDGILQAIAPLQEVDLFALRWNFARLTEAVEALWQQVKTGLGYVWENVLAPFGVWIVEQFVPTALLALKRATELLSAVLSPLAEGFRKIYEAMQPVFRFVGECLLTAIDQLGRLFVKVANTFREEGDGIVAAFDKITQGITYAWSVVGPLLWNLKIEVCQVFAQVREMVCNAVSLMVSAFDGFADFLLGAFTGDWDRAWGGLKKLLKNAVNGILSLINGMLTGLGGGINAVIKMLNKLRFSLPDWVPQLGGKSFGLNLSTVKVPQIPYLAKGAVLPANKPFLAMVGDQTHGTNVEAPLATIQQAVAQVLSDMVPAMVAGFEHTHGLQRSLIAAVQALDFSDGALAGAVNRYNRRMETVRGV